MCGKLQLSATERAIVASGKILKGINAPLGAFIRFGEKGDLQGVESCFARHEKIDPSSNTWAGLRILRQDLVHVVGWTEKGREFRKTANITVITVRDALGRERAVVVTCKDGGPYLPAKGVETVRG